MWGIGFNSILLFRERVQEFITCLSVLTELHQNTGRSPQVGHLILYWLTFKYTFPLDSNFCENLREFTTHSTSFALVDLLGSYQHKSKTQEKYIWVFSKQGGHSRGDKALLRIWNMCRTTIFSFPCATLGLFLEFQQVIKWKLSIVIIGRHLLSKFWCHGSQMLLTWFTLVPQWQEEA